MAPPRTAHSSEPALSTGAGVAVYASRATNLVVPAIGGQTNVYATSLRATLGVTATEPPAINAGLSRFTTTVGCNIMCVVWATGKITVTDANGNASVRNAAGYGAQAVSAGGSRSIVVYLLPATVSWLKRELNAGKTAAVEIKLQATGMRGESATAYSRGPVTLPAPAPAG